jgi:hypothetical protein
MKKLSLLLTFIFSLLIALQWYQHHTDYEYNDHELLNKQSIDDHLESFELTGSDEIATGIFVKSLQFVGANDVHVSGYVWQEFSVQELEKHQPGVIFRNSVGSSIMKESYTSKIDGITVIGWYFEVNLRQPFSYKDYPLDHKIVWIKLLPKDFHSNVILIPSLKSYDKIAAHSVFGIAEDIVVSGWSISDTFFDYMPLNFDTDFGLHDNHPRTNLPELSFNIVIERDFLSAFMINITLLLVSMTLLYSLIMIMTSNEELSSRFGSSVDSAIGSGAGIFFVILIAHISVKETFPSAGIVYIEYLYLLSYLFILSTIIAIYSFHADKNLKLKVFFDNEAALLKISFWPLYSFCICLITWYHFW